MLVTAAVPAWSAQVTDVRLGKHAGFSRVVFELDSPVGYKVERSTPAAGINELVISLDASAKPQTLRGKLDFIEHVSVQPSAGNRSTVRIRLKGDDLRLKEMILASPPRIVLDVLNERAMAEAERAETEKAEALAASKARARAKAKARQAKLAQANSEKAASQAESEAAKAQAAAAERARAEEARVQAEAKARATAQAKAESEAAKAQERERAQAQAKAEAKAKAEAQARADEQARQAALRADAEAKKQKLAAAALVRQKEREAAEKLAIAKREAAKATPQPPASMPQGETGSSTGAPREFAMNAKPSVSPGAVPAAQEMPTAVIPTSKPAPKPAATARPKATPTRPAAVAPASEGGLFSTMNIAVGGVGLLLLAGAAFVFMRRRDAAEVVDASAFDTPLEDGSNPFAGLDPEVGVAAGDEVEAVTEELPISEAAQAEVGIPIPEEDEAKSDESVSQDKDSQGKESKEGTDMDMVSDNAQTTSFNAPPVGVMGGDDVSRMVAEFERRMAAMETRIEELVDSKERLERQVAAQTEELRVQRAAIARTQRAVRNLSRPEEGDAPTEPALRDPSRPEGPRE